MANSALAASGIILVLLGLVLYYAPVENYIQIDMKMSPAEICDSLGQIMPPKYQKFCETSSGVMENPSPYIIYSAYISFIVGIILTIVGLVQRKKPSMFMCKECDYAGNTKADLHNHKIEKHKQTEESEENEESEEIDDDE